MAAPWRGGLIKSDDTFLFQEGEQKRRVYNGTWTCEGGWNFQSHKGPSTKTLKQTALIFSLRKVEKYHFSLAKRQ